jgi:hypothetical protein
VQRINHSPSEKDFSLTVFFIIFLVTFSIYSLSTGWHPHPYNNFVRLADAFLNGRLNLDGNLPTLEFARFNGRYYVVPPPMPALIIMPIVAVFGLDTNQTLLSVLIASLNASLIYLVATAITKNRRIQLWGTAMFVFGTIHWWVAVNGSVWMFSHTTSVTFLLLAIYFSLKGKNPLITGIWLGSAYWCRLPTILSLPFFLAMYYNPRRTESNNSSIITSLNLKAVIYFCLGVGIFLGLNSLYNYLRFGTATDVSYYLIPGVLEEPWYQKGIFDITYIPRHISAILFSLPVIKSEFPYIYPSMTGLAIWITTPAFIYAFVADIRTRIAIGCWVSIFIISIANFTHGTWGFAQFGYRFAMDFYPFLFLLTIMGIGNDIKWHHKLLISLGIIVNLWGVLWMYKFGWVIFPPELPR